MLGCFSLAAANWTKLSNKFIRFCYQNKMIQIL